MALEAKGRRLMEGRDRRLRVVDLRPKSLLTEVGEVTITRRHYVDRGVRELTVEWEADGARSGLG